MPIFPHIECHGSSSIHEGGGWLGRSRKRMRVALEADFLSVTIISNVTPSWDDMTDRCEGINQASSFPELVSCMRHVHVQEDMDPAMYPPKSSVHVHVCLATRVRGERQAQRVTHYLHALQPCYLPKRPVSSVQFPFPSSTEEGDREETSREREMPRWGTLLSGHWHWLARDPSSSSSSISEMDVSRQW